jgi:hypothetical protein
MTHPPEFYDERGIYIPRLYGQPWNYWWREHGLRNVAEIKAYVIAQSIKLHLSGALEFRELPKELK